MDQLFSLGFMSWTERLRVKNAMIRQITLILTLLIQIIEELGSTREFIQKIQISEITLILSVNSEASGNQSFQNDIYNSWKRFQRF